MSIGLTGLVIPIAVSVTFAFARRRLAASAMKPPEGEYLNIPFGGTWGINTCIVLVGVLFAISTYPALVWLNRYIAATKGPAEFMLWPQDAIWWFFPGFGALSFSWEIVLQSGANFGNRAKAQTAGFDSTRILRLFAVFITLPIGILTIFALPMHTALRQDDILDCGYGFESCQTYRYADARRMTAIEGFRDRNGSLTRRAGIVIDFQDGRRWSSAEIGDFKPTVDPTLVEFLAKKMQLPLNHAQAEPDIHLLKSDLHR